MVDGFDLARSKLPGSCLSDQKEKKKKGRMIVITRFKKSLIFCCKNEPIKTFQVCEFEGRIVAKNRENGFGKHCVSYLRTRFHVCITINLSGPTN